MSARISRLYGMDIYTDSGRFLGKVQDMIIDMEKGEVVRVTMEPLSSVSREEARRIIREGSILYKNVKSVEDVVVVSKSGTVGGGSVEDVGGKAGFGFSRR